MDISTYTALVAERLHRRPYVERIVDLSDDIHLLLTFKYSMFARYALAICPWELLPDDSQFLKSKRRAVARQLRALWILREVGLYLIVCGSQSEWQPYVSKMRADKTGLHSVIVQAVHFIDLQNGATHLNQSAWGPVKFGGVDSIADVINSISLNDSSHIEIDI